MERTWILLVGVMGVFLARTPDLAAEAVGSPASILKKGRWVMGLGGGGAQRDLKGDAEARVIQGGHFRGYGLTDWLSLYGKIGIASLEVDDPAIIKTTTPSTTNDFGLTVLTSAQVKLRLYEHQAGQWEWDGGLQYVDIRARRKGKNEGRWHEWQASTSVAKAIGRLTAYLGVKYDIVDFSFKVRENGAIVKQDKYEEEGPVGVFVGTDVYLGSSENVVLNVESAYQDGAEVDVAVAYTF